MRANTAIAAKASHPTARVYRVGAAGARLTDITELELIDSALVTTTEFSGLLQAPFVRRQVLRRVGMLLDRYDALLAPPSDGRDGLRVPVLFRFPSALRESDAVGRKVLAQRRRLVEEELRALKAAAPIPAPVDRPDRLLIQGLAEAQWLARELRALRRAGRGRPVAAAIELYHETRPQDALPEAKALLAPLRRLPRGRLVNLAFELAEVRFGVPGLVDWLVTAPSNPGDSEGPVTAGPAASLHEGCGRRVTVRERPVAVFRHGNRIAAVGAVCPHRGGPLDEGQVTDGAVLCPLHDWAFDLDTGHMRGRPNVRVPVYRTEVRDGEIWIHPLPEGAERTE